MIERLRARFRRWLHLMATFTKLPAAHCAMNYWRWQPDHEEGGCWVISSIECDCGRVFWKEPSP